MKILFLLTYYYPHWTGLSQYAQRLAEALTRKDYSITVLTVQHSRDLDQTERYRGVEIHRKPYLFRLSRTLVSPQLIFSFWKEIGASDKVVVYLPFSEVLIVALIARLLGKRLFLVHNGDLKLPSGFINSFIESFYYFSTRMAILLAKAVIIQTEDYAASSKLLRPFRDKWEVIPPLFPLRTRKIGHPVTFRPAKQGGPIIGFAGRFVEEKGFDVLLSAIPLVLKAEPKAHFLFAGETKIPYERFYEKHSLRIQTLSSHLTLLGKLDEEEMTAFYRALTLLVLPSRSDCYPSVGVEALLSGLPLVVSDIPGARMQVKETGMGVIVQKENPYALAQGILEVLQNRKKYVRNRVRAKTFFDYETALGSYQEILK